MDSLLSNKKQVSDLRELGRSISRETQTHGKPVSITRAVRREEVVLIPTRLINSVLSKQGTLPQ